MNSVSVNDWFSDSDSSVDNMYEYILVIGEYLVLVMFLFVMVVGLIIGWCWIYCNIMVFLI